MTGQAGDVHAMRRDRRRPQTGSARAAAPCCPRFAVSPSRGQDSPREGPCADCGDATYVDEYCAACGNRRAEPDRDQAELDGIVLITDRGLEHPRNEDAAAAGIVLGCGSRATAIAVAVCDGVSTSTAADMAAEAASTAGVDAMLNALAASRKPESAVLAGLTDAAEAAAAAGATPDPAIAPSCTYSAVAVVPDLDGTARDRRRQRRGQQGVLASRTARAPQCLTVDDSVAQELISAGAAADSEAVQAGAHTMTRWLGADAEPTPWSDSSVQHDHHRRAGFAGAVHRRPVELPARRRRHRAILRRNRPDRGGPRARRLRVGRRRPRQHHRRRDPDRRTS